MDTPRSPYCSDSVRVYVTSTVAVRSTDRYGLRLSYARARGLSDTLEGFHRLHCCRRLLCPRTRHRRGDGRLERSVARLGQAACGGKGERAEGAKDPEGVEADRRDEERREVADARVAHPVGGGREPRRLGAVFEREELRTVDPDDGPPPIGKVEYEEEDE